MREEKLGQSVRYQRVGITLFFCLFIHFSFLPSFTIEGGWLWVVNNQYGEGSINERGWQNITTPETQDEEKNNGKKICATPTKSSSIADSATSCSTGIFPCFQGSWRAKFSSARESQKRKREKAREGIHVALIFFQFWSLYFCSKFVVYLFTFSLSPSHAFFHPIHPYFKALTDTCFANKQTKHCFSQPIRHLPHFSLIVTFFASPQFYTFYIFSFFTFLYV